MGIKLADTLEPMGDFPAAKSSDVELTLLNGSKKRLQDAYNDGDLGGSSSSSTDPEEYSRNEDGDYTSTYVEIIEDIGAPSGSEGRDYCLPAWETNHYVFVNGEYGDYTSGMKDTNVYWHENFCGYHFAFIDKKEGKLQMFFKYDSNTFLEDLNKYKICLVYCKESHYFTFKDYNEWNVYNLDPSVDWYSYMWDYTHELHLVKEICEAKDAYFNKRAEPNKIEIRAAKTDSDADAEDKVVYFVKGEIQSYNKDSWETGYVVNNDVHFGFLNETTGDITPWIEKSEFSTYNKICLFKANYANGKNWNGRSGENNLQLLQVIGNNSESLISSRRIWAANSDDLTVIPAPDGVTNSTMITGVIESNGTLFGVLKSPNRIIVLRNFTTGWETLVNDDDIDGFRAFGVSENGLIDLDANRLIAVCNGISSPKLFTIDKTSGTVTAIYDFSTPSGLSSATVNKFVKNPNTGDYFVEVISYTDYTAQLWKSTNLTTWTKVLQRDHVGPSSTTTPGFIPYFFKNGDILIASSRDGLFKSTDDGDTFTQTVSDTSNTAFYNNPVVIHEDKEETGILRNGNGVLYIYYYNGEAIDTLSTDIKLDEMYETDDGMFGVNYHGKTNPDLPSSGTGVLELYRLRDVQDWSSWERVFRDPDNKQMYHQNPKSNYKLGKEIIFSSTSLDNQGMFSTTNGKDTEYNRSLGTCGRYINVIGDNMVVVNLKNSSGGNYYNNTVYFNINQE